MTSPSLTLTPQMRSNYVGLVIEYLKVCGTLPRLRREAQEFPSVDAELDLRAAERAHEKLRYTYCKATMAVTRLAPAESYKLASEIKKRHGLRWYRVASRPVAPEISLSLRLSPKVVPTAFIAGVCLWSPLAAVFALPLAWVIFRILVGLVEVRNYEAWSTMRLEAELYRSVQKLADLLQLPVRSLTSTLVYGLARLYSPPAPVQRSNSTASAASSASWRGDHVSSASAWDSSRSDNIAANHYYDKYSSYDSPASSYPDVNPANGLPMIDGTPIDVGGHVFGTDW